ncbi:TIGR03086 family metal-binding protein [Amycolatopsis nigrescens]|uniref:TIGR03086 family metal-binding protein n=1 Tax=Amycolatopsis nigrescens TaxID=381445 RepID=UPI00036ACED6|nr:TIGR03086 family metal-binding protein [Amycolatopsis nigrescens]
MDGERVASPLLGGVALLERAIGYALGSLRDVTPEVLAHRTPCRDWDLRALLAHLDDSLIALLEASTRGRVGLSAPEPEAGPGGDPVAGLRNRAGRLLGAWTGAERPDAVSVAGSPLTAGILTSAGAVEVAVHGWDVARACGRDRPIPAALAEELLELSGLLVSEADRPVRFAGPVEPPPLAGPADRLVAFLGRTP